MHAVDQKIDLLFGAAELAEPFFRFVEHGFEDIQGGVRVVVNSPFLGGVFSFVSSVFGLLVLLLIPAFYLVVTSVIDIFKAYKEPEEEKESASKTSNNGPIQLSEEDKKRLKEQLLEEMLNKKKGGNADENK